MTFFFFFVLGLNAWLLAISASRCREINDSFSRPSINFQPPFHSLPAHLILSLKTKVYSLLCYSLEVIFSFLFISLGFFTVNMPRCCEKTNKIAISFPWCQLPSPAVNLVTSVPTGSAGQWWAVITITAIGLMPLVSRMNPSQHSRTGNHCQLIKVMRENLFAIPGCDEDSQLLDLQSTNNSEGVGPGWWKEHCTGRSVCRSGSATVNRDFSFRDRHFPHLPISSSMKPGGWTLC